MKMPVVSVHLDKYFGREYLPFRELDWHLCEVERSVQRKDGKSISNAVCDVVHLLDCYKIFFKDHASNETRRFPMRLRMAMLEKIELSLARMVIGRERSEVASYLDVLLPESIIKDSMQLPSWHSVTTFKQMLLIAVAIENFHDKEGCYPLNLGVLKLVDKDLKCACGRDIEYEYSHDVWLLRSRCESWEGGLKFDEYIPTIYQQRKHLDLCFSRTFNAKRKALFYGRSMGDGDVRLAGRVVHDDVKNGIHFINFTNPTAGCGRIVPLSEYLKNGKIDD